MLGLNLGTTEQIYSTTPWNENGSKEPHYQAVELAERYFVILVFASVGLC
jgi:hypothetical protein